MKRTATLDELYQTTSGVGHPHHGNPTEIHSRGHATTFTKRISAGSDLTHAFTSGLCQVRIPGAYQDLFGGPGPFSQGSDFGRETFRKARDDHIRTTLGTERMQRINAPASPIQRSARSLYHDRIASSKVEAPLGSHLTATHITSLCTPRSSRSVLCHASSEPPLYHVSCNDSQSHAPHATSTLLHVI